MLRNVLFFFILLLLIPALSYGQRYPFRTYSIEQGLSESVVYDIEQDSEGYVWLATSFGLTRYDGIITETFFEENGLKSNELNTVYLDNDGKIWIGTQAGVNYWNKEGIRSDKQFDALNGLSVLSIYKDRNGHMWFGTDGNGVWNYNNNRLIQYSTVNGLVNDQVRAIAEDENGALYFGTRGGLTTLQDGNFRSFTTANGLPENRIRDLLSLSEGKLIIATRNGLAELENNSFRLINSSDGLINDRTTTLTKDDQGGIWIGTEEGLSYYENNSFQNYTMDSGLSNNFVNTSMKDREGNIWIGTYGGGASIFLGDYFRNFDTDNGLRNNVVSSIAESEDETIWIGMYGGGVTSLKDGVFDDQGINSSLPDDKVYHLFFDSKDVLWIGLRDGLATYDKKEIYIFPDEVFPFRKVRNIMEASDGSYWISLEEGGIVHFINNEFIQYDESKGLISNSVRRTIEDEKGNIWVATYGGISKWDGSSFMNYSIAEGLPNNAVTHIYEDDEGTIWATTTDGLVWFDGDMFQSITQADGLPDKKLYFISKGMHGKYWLGSTKGIIRFDRGKYFSEDERERAFKLITNDQGLVGDESNTGAVLKDSNNDFWFGSVEGLSNFLPDRYPGSIVPPELHMLKFNASGENYQIDDAIKLKYDRNYVEIEYAGINISAPDQVIFQYQLSGVDPDWQQTTDRIVKYPSVPSGDHRFRLRARNPDGTWNEEVKSLQFEVASPFWLSWWFLMLITAAVVSIIILFYNFYRAKKLIDIERMRVRIASDLHDDVGASLTEIALQSDFLQAGKVDSEIGNSLKQIGKQCRKIVNSLDDIVWSIDARNDTLGDLTDRMQDYVLNTLEHKDMSVSYDFEDLRMENKLPVELKENLYLIFKEAVNNVSKYSNGDEVEISIHTDNGDYALEVYDNGTTGRGNKKTGHGLRNMEMRAKRIGASINMGFDDGFRIEVKGNINQN